MAGAALGRPTWPGKARIVTFGELLWDVFADGARLGGSPANVAYHVALLGAPATLISRVGADVRGRLATQRLLASGVDTRLIQNDPQLPTGTVDVEFRGSEPSYHIKTPAAWDAIAVPPHLPTPAVFCFGTLAARCATTRTTLIRLLQHMDQMPTADRPVRLLDLNLRPPHADISTVRANLRYAEVAKLNDEELSWLEQHVGQGNGLDYLLDRHGLRWVIISHGAGGATLHGHALRAHQPGIVVSGGDPVGAGDALVAAFAVLLSRGKHPLDALSSANRYAAWVASERGAMPAKNARTPRI